MLSKKINTLLNKQIELEAKSSNAYLSMASWAEVQGWNGVSVFLYKHSDEERMHMLKLFHFVNERGGQAVVPEIKGLKSSYSSITELFEEVLEHEVNVTNEINALVDACLAEKDYTTHNFLQWYVAEQIEEERLIRNILDKLKLIGEEKSGLYMFDRDMSQMSNQAHG
ncbi:MAG: ferritin [Bacteroidetes bacterium]|nr:MAG: ferritin [Bacteroidota bacterium]REK05759.1 MAG: ferritin [Bacteroidota bacterium]REK31934.1 MAG: ferritin [Bacteroidota bacterium]REK50000.1 MAG: ferritin [Bacteroidota bacterium]